MSFLKEVEHLQIPLQDIVSATNNFAKQNFIGKGGFGEVYQGQSEQHGMVAIKRPVNPRPGQGDRDFMMEIALLSTYKHENIVSLIGFCTKDNEKILVYKHETKGSLDKYLHRKDLTWIQRLQICIDAARGLKYLHHDVGPQHRIIHRDIKSSNILLDENWKAKISDFGLSKIGPANVQHTFLISNACGTIGYIDPEYLHTGVLTKESDVFSFGVVLFEVLCGRPASVKVEGQFLFTLAQNHYETETLDEIIRPDLLEQINAASLSTFSAIAIKCLKKRREARPTMRAVVEELREALNYQLASGGSGPVLRNVADHPEGLLTYKDNETHSNMSIQQSRLPSLSFSHSSSASSDSWNHDVFLSFGEDDICKSFVDHLYSAFKQKGIHTYMRGELVNPSFKKAIQESKIAIIVLSKNCISCRFLDEVAYIMKCMDERGKVVKAIFYGEDDILQMREDVQNIGEAISKLELVNDRKVGSWRNAMMHASNLSGWVPNYFANGHDSKCINQIVDTVSLGLLPLILSSNTILVGMETRMLALKSMLEIGVGDVRMVGIWGIGGGGKSTLAFSIYKEICHEFDRCCFVGNICKESSEHGLEILQQKILTDVLKPKQVVVSSIEEGKCMIKSRLHNSSVLIVLDDVGHIDQLKALAGSHDWFGKGSRIIITTRNEDILDDHGINATYRPSLLNNKEAVELFSRHAFGKNRSVKDYEKLSLDVVSKAGGLPLALESLGSFLYDKDTNEWTSELKSSIPYFKTLENLKLSYYGLDHEERELFLEIACLVAANLGHWAVIILDACGFDYVKGVDVLVKRDLITISDGIITMHDLVKEMGLYIVQKEHPNSPEHSRVWKKEDFMNICGMDTTKVVANMKKIRWICCPEFPEDMLATHFQPPDLCCLLLEASLQKQLWEGYKHLPSLKVLILNNSNNLIRTPDFSGLPCLERLSFHKCENLEEIHPSIGYHERIVFLDFQNSLKLQMFPPIVRMKKLETLILTRCYYLTEVPEIQTKLDSLVRLSLSSTAIKVVPSSVAKYCTNLISLELRTCRNLKSIEGNFCSLKNLKELHLTGCNRLGKLPNDLFDVDSCLELLSLSSNMTIYSVTGLMSMMSRFSRTYLLISKFPRFPRFIKKLDLRGCNLVDGDIPSDICELSNLQELDLSGNNFSRLDSVLSQLPRLKYLNLSYCRSLRKLPFLPSSIAFLEADVCDSLELLEDFPTSYKWLWHVSIWKSYVLSGNSRVLRSMLQGKAIQDYFISLKLRNGPSKKQEERWKPLILKLPRNWYHEFSGFLICIDKRAQCNETIRIIIKQETSIDSQRSNDWEKFDETLENDGYAMVGYVSFGSLRHTSWWNSAHTKISFAFENANSKVALVPSKSEGHSSGGNGTVTDRSEFWDKVDEDKGYTTFKIQHDSKHSIEISWTVPYRRF